MNRQVPWARVFVEGVVIIASILLAFGIDAWWARRSTEVEARAELTRIHAELVLDRERIATRVRTQELVAAAALKFAELLDTTGQATVAVPDTLARRLLRAGTYETQTPALDGLMSSGRISLIQDVGVRSAIATWERAVRNASEQQLRTRWVADEYLLPALSDRGDIAHVVRSEASGLPYRSELLASADLEVDPIASTRVTADGPLKTAVSLRFSSAARAFFALDGVLQSTDALVAAIEATRAR